MIWESIRIKRNNGDVVDGIAPVIISASRSTDIPAFYSQWFINRINNGYLSWKNPFNGQEMFVSFAKCRLIVFWTKDAKCIMPKLHDIENIGVNYYFQFTINDYHNEGLEPNVPPLDERINTFQMLSEKIGKNRVIWRYDPLIMTDKMGVDELLAKVISVGNKLRSFTDKLVISFADISIYNKVQNNLRHLNCREFNENEMMMFAKELSPYKTKWGVDIGTCGEKMDLDAYGIRHNKCIDDELIIKLFNNDSALMAFLGYDNAVNLWGDRELKIKKKLKDKGQRKECGCIVSKDIGIYNTCDHQCVYCYANTSPNIGRINLSKHNPEDESIL